MYSAAQLFHFSLFFYFPDQNKGGHLGGLAGGIVGYHGPEILLGFPDDGGLAQKLYIQVVGDRKSTRLNSSHL